MEDGNCLSVRGNGSAAKASDGWHVWPKAGIGNLRAHLARPGCIPADALGSMKQQVLQRRRCCVFPAYSLFFTSTAAGRLFALVTEHAHYLLPLLFVCHCSLTRDIVRRAVGNKIDVDQENILF